MKRRFSTCGLSFALSAEDSLQQVVDDLVQPFESRQPPSYELDIRVGASSDASCDPMRTYTAEECGRFCRTLSHGASHLVCEIDLPHVDLVSAAIGSIVLLALCQNDGFLLHASALEVDKTAHVFVGPSGAGKSTIVRNASRGITIHDENVAIRHAAGRWMCAGVPMADNQRRTGRPVFVPLGGIYLLQKSSRLNKSRESKLEAIDGLHAQFKMIFKEESLVRRATESLLRVCSDLPCWRMEFKRDSDVTKHPSILSCADESHA